MSETSDIASMATKLATSPTLVTDKRGVEFLVLPAANGGYTHHQITPAIEVMPKPAFASANISLTTTASLIDYVNRFKTADTMLFADKVNARVVACIDYHKADNTPAPRAHKATLILQHSPEWIAWGGEDDEWQAQEAMAQWLSERKREITFPDGAQLREMIMDMEKGINIRVSRKMTSAFSDRGSKDSTVDIAGTDIPPEWTIVLPVYSGEPPVTMTVFAKDKVQGTEQHFGYKRSQVDQIIEAELTRIATAIAGKTSVPMVLGTIG